MDELKIISPIMRRLVSKIIESVIRKKLGYKVQISLNDLYITVNDNSAHINAKIEADMPIEELKKFNKFVDEN